MGACQGLGAWQTGAAGRPKTTRRVFGQDEKEDDMAVRDLIPWGRNQSSVPTNMQGGSELDPFLTLHREMTGFLTTCSTASRAAVPIRPHAGLGGRQLLAEH